MQRIPRCTDRERSAGGRLAHLFGCATEADRRLPRGHVVRETPRAEVETRLLERAPDGDRVRCARESRRSERWADDPGGDRRGAREIPDGDLRISRGTGPRRHPAAGPVPRQLACRKKKAPEEETFLLAF